MAKGKVCTHNNPSSILKYAFYFLSAPSRKKKEEEKLLASPLTVRCMCVCIHVMCNCDIFAYNKYNKRKV